MFLPRKGPADSAAWDGALRVPFEDKDAAKALGAVWDLERRLWVVPPKLHHLREAFAAWDAPSAQTASSYAAKAGASVAEPSGAAAAAAVTAAVAVELQNKRDRITRELARAVCGAARSRG